VKTLVSEIEIDASADRVWTALTDFAAYPEWNPFILEATGTPEPGARLRIRIRPPGGRPMTFRPTVLVAEPGRRLQWRGRLILPRVFDGEHVFEIEPLTEGRVRFTQSERFSGALVPLFAGTLAKTEAGFHAMNAALKARAEASETDTPQVATVER
jgi:hypothetical protein